MASQAPVSIDATSLRTGILWLVSSVGIGHAISFVSAPLLIVLYSPESFGSFALCSVVATMIGNLSAARFERAIVLAPSNDDAKLMLRACMCLNALAGIVVLVVVAVCERYIDLFAGLGPSLMITVATLTIAFGANQTLAHWLTRRECFPQIALADLCLTLVMLAWQVVLGLCGRASAESLLGGMLLGRLVSIVILLLAAGSLGFTEQRGFGDLRRLFIHYGTLAIYSTPNALVTMLQFRALLFAVAHFSGLAAAGRLAIAYRLTYVPATAFGLALRRVFFPAFSRALKQRRTNELALAMVEFLGIVVPPIAIGCSLLLSSYGGLLPDNWQDARSYIQCLLPVAAVLVFTSWFDQVYDVLHLQRSALILECGSSLIAVGLFCTMLAVGTTAQAALAAYSIWIFVYNVAWLGITWQLTEWPQSQYVRALLALSAYSLALCIAFVVGEIHLPLAFALLVCGGLAAWRHFSNVNYWLANHVKFACEEVA